MRYFFVFYLGTLFGSFLTLAAERIPLQKSILFPRSHCTHCHMTLSWFELLPLFSQVILKNRCAHCQTKLPLLYLVSESSLGIIFMLFYMRYFHLFFLPLFFLWVMCYLLALTDYFYFLVSPTILYSFTCLLFGTNLLFPYFSVDVLGSLAIGIGLWLLANLTANSLGQGDVKLLSVITFFIGFHAMVLLLFFASIFALFWLGVRRFFWSRSLFEKLPFVPFIFLGLIVVNLFFF